MNKFRIESKNGNVIYGCNFLTKGAGQDTLLAYNSMCSHEFTIDEIVSIKLESDVYNKNPVQKKQLFGHEGLVLKLLIANIILTSILIICLFIQSYK